MELTVDTIKRRSGHYDVSLVALLDVSHLKIRRLAQLESCVNLLELNLVHNELRSLEGLPPLQRLRCLELCHNQLTSLDRLPHLPLLEKLTIANNQIRSIDFVELSIKLPSLRILDFSCNDLDENASVKASKAFPELFILNGEALTLTKLLEEIVSVDFDKSSDVSEDAGLLETYIEHDNGIGDSKDDDIGVHEFINESTKRLEELLQRCQQTLATTEPELIFPA